MISVSSLFNLRGGLAAVLLMFTALLTACGGGGGGDSGGTGALPAPVISVQPNPVSAVAGASATFSITATGASLTYQWQSRIGPAAAFANIAGATSATYVIAAVDASMNGYQYQAVVSSSGGTVTSSPATLTVTPAVVAPAITVQPTDQTALVGATATFSVTATGSMLSYAWQFSLDNTTWQSFSGALSTGGTLALPLLRLADSGQHVRVVISNSAGSVTSDSVLLTVNAPASAPQITSQPAATSAVVSGTATFTVIATGTPAPTYQWQLSADNGASYSDIVGATSATYTTPAAVNADNGKRFRVNVSNSAGSVTSASVILTVTPGSAPVVSTQPPDQVAYTTMNDFGAPHTATFPSGASGAPSPSLQWQVSTDGGSTFTDIAGATAASYTTPAVMASDNNSQYRLVATNTLGVSRSRAATLTVANIGTGLRTAGIAVSQGGEILASGMEFDPTGNAGTFTGQFMGVRVVHPSGAVTTLAGGGATDTVDIDGTGSAARLYVPTSVALDAAGNAYVPDGGNRVRKITPLGVVTTLAGGDAQGGFDNGNGQSASFRFSSSGLVQPNGIALDAAGNVYVTDAGNVAIRKISPTGDVTTLAGGTSGFVDGTGSAAKFMHPRAIAIDSVGNLYVVDNGNITNTPCGIRKVTPAGVVTTITQGVNGNSCGTAVDGPIASARFAYPSAIAVDGTGNIYVAESVGGVRKITPAGVVSTLTGVEKGALAVDGASNLYVSWETETYLAVGGGTKAISAVIQKVTPAGDVTLLP